MEKDTYYLVDKNGEVVDEVLAEVGKKGRLIYAEEGDRLVKNSSRLAYNRKKKCGRVDIDFAKVNRRYMDKITWKYPLVMTLVKYINHIDNILMYSNGKTLNPTNLSRVTGISLSTCKRQFKSLIELGIVKRTKIRNKFVYVFDPYLASCSKDIDIETLDLFYGSEYREVK